MTPWWQSGADERVFRHPDGDLRFIAKADMTNRVVRVEMEVLGDDGVFSCVTSPSPGGPGLGAKGRGRGEKDS